MTRRWRLPAKILCVLVVLLTATSCADTTERADAPTEAEVAADYAQYDELFADWAPRYVECARKYGADARLSETSKGSIENAYAEGRPVEDGLDADCLAEVGAPPSPPPLTDAFLSGLYQLYMVQAECLRGNGYAISAAPSEAEWVETYDGHSWNPLMDVHQAGGDVIQAGRLCPQPDPREAEMLGGER